VLYGPEGIGKSTLASQFPSPIFIDLEHGTDTMDIARTDTPKTFNDVLTLMTMILEEDEFKTVVIDTADKLEQLITAHVLEAHHLNSIEDAGYGKGYTYIAEEFVRFLRKCGELIDAGKNVVIVAHAMMRKFEQPDEMGAYDRWELKLSKKAAPLVKEWADMVLFLNYKTTVVTDEKTKSKKARGGKRVMYATHHPAWDAKNRFGLDDELDMDFDSIRQCFVEPPKAPDVYTQIRTKLDEGGVKEEKVMEYLHEKDPNLREDAVALEMLPPKYLKALNNSISKIINILKED
jgi:hypothetical protein